MRIILDERESSLWEKIQGNNGAFSVPDIIFGKTVLHLGDISIQTDDSKEIVLLERKSLQDLLSSIKDGRYEEQSYRLIHSSGHPPHNIIYIVEGIMSQLRPTEKTLVYSAMTSLNLFKGFSVIRTASVQETADWILAMTGKISRDLKKGRTFCFSNQTPGETPTPNVSATAVPADYCTVVKKVKKDNLTPENMGQIILCQIPTISSITAIAIMQKYKSISQLIAALRAEPGCLDDFQVNSRKMSKSVIQKIKDFLLYEYLSGNENAYVDACKNQGQIDE